MKKAGNKKLLEHLEMVSEILIRQRNGNLFDYGAIRFTQPQTKDDVIEDHEHPDAVHREARFCGWAGRQVYLRSISTVMVSPEHEKGILLELKGKG